MWEGRMKRKGPLLNYINERGGVALGDPTRRSVGAAHRVEETSGGSGLAPPPSWPSQESCHKLVPPISDFDWSEAWQPPRTWRWEGPCRNLHQPPRASTIAVGRAGPE